MTRPRRWITARALMVPAVLLVAACAGAWGAGLASSEWPMFQRDAVHTGNAQVGGPAQPEIRWFQGGAPIIPFESEYTPRGQGPPHGPQGAIASSAATSEVNVNLAGATKVWYFHFNTWPGRGSAPPAPGEPLMLRSEFPDDEQAVIALSDAVERMWETSAAMQHLGAGGSTLETLIFRNRDPYSNLEFVKQNGTFLLQKRIPAGVWTFDFWVTNVPAPTNLLFTVYSFPRGSNTAVTRQPLAGLSPVSVPIPATPAGALRRIIFTATTLNPVRIGAEDGIAIGARTAAGASANLAVEGRTPSRVVTPIEVPAVYAGADDGSVWAFDAATGNVLWSFAMPGAHFRSSPAVGDDGAVYIGSSQGVGRAQGRLYALNPDGTIKWTYPATERFLYLRSAFLAPDDPADFPADTAPLYFAPGSGVNPNPDTIAQTGTDATGRHVVFRPRATNAVLLDDLPASLSSGWLGEINPTATERVMHPGSWRLNLALRATASNTTAAVGLVNYRLSQVEVGAGPALTLVEEMLGWTQHPQAILLPAGGAPVFVDIVTPTIGETGWVGGQLVLVELAVTQTAGSGAALGGWELLLDGEAIVGGPHSQVTTPALTLAPLSAVTASPVISGDDVVYIGTHGGEVHAVEAASGSARWSRALREAGIADELRSSPAVSAGGKVYVGSMNGRLYALDADDGEVLWRFPVPGQPALGSIESSPALDEGRGRIYFGANDGFIYAVQPVVDPAANQIVPQEVWRFDTFVPADPFSPEIPRGEVRATPAIAADGTLYLGALNHHLYAIRPEGTLAAGQWPRQVNGEIHSSAAIAQPARFFFVNETAPTEDPPIADEPPTRPRLRASSPTGDRTAGRISLLLFNPAPTAGPVPATKFDREFRTRLQSSEPGMPTALPRGTYVMDFWARASIREDAGEEARISFWVFHCTPADPVGTLVLGFPEVRVRATAAPRAYRVEAQLPAEREFDPSHYLRVEVWGSATLLGGGTGTVSFPFDGDFSSRLEGPPLIFFATSVVRLTSPAPQTVPVGRVYALDDKGEVIWIDPNPVDPSAGFNPRDGNPPVFTAFTASPALWDAETPFGVVDGSGNVVLVARRREPVVYIGGQDGVMYALGTTRGFIAPPPVVPPAVAPASELTLTKQATAGVAQVGGLITFQLRYTNTGTIFAQPARSAIIEDPLPADVTFISASDGGQNLAGIVTWTAAGKPDLAIIWPGQSGMVSFQGRVNDDLRVVDPLGAEGSGEYVQPLVTLSTTDPLRDGVTPPNDDVDFVWGQPLYLEVIGVGKPGEVVNSPPTAPAIISAFTGEAAVAGPVTVFAGWGERYRLSFIYSPANDPNPAAPPYNQDLIYTIEIIPPVSETRTGRAEEGVATTLPPGTYDGYLLRYPQYPADELAVMVFKVQLQARGFASATRDLPVTDPPNRAWTPYYWRVELQQSTGGPAGEDEWGPVWMPYTDPITGARTGGLHDFVVQNPLEVAPVPFALAGGATVNPGTRTDRRGLTIANRTRQPLVGTGRTPQPNVVRWEMVDLAQSTLAYNNPDPAYQYRDENYLPESRIHPETRQMSLGPGQSNSVALWADIPRYLSPGIYQAPNPDPATLTSQMPIFVDLNGNLGWDPGEAIFEDFVMWTAVALQPQAQFSTRTVDYGKAAPGVVPAAPAPDLLNLGNADLLPIPPDTLAIPLDPRHPSGLLPLQRVDLGDLGLRDWADTRPTWLDLSEAGGAVAKTPVGWPRPLRQPLLLADPVLAWDQPSGSYTGLPEAVATVGGISDRTGARFKLRIVERRLTGYDGAGQPLAGADIEPWAAWVDGSTLRVFWSSNSRADGTAPTAGDPFWLRYATYDRASDAWSDVQTYPLAGGDPMDLPAPPTWNAWVTKQHMTPGFGFDADNTGWLFWGGSALRPGTAGGHFYDNRLLWTSWPLGGAPIEDLPAVAGSPTPEAAATDLFRTQPRPLFWEQGGTEYNLVVLSERSFTQPWRLALRYRSRPSGGAWSPWADAVLEAPSASSGLTAVRDPSAFLHDGYLWVAFSGVSAYHGNYDIYLARYDPATLGKVPFARVLGGAMEPNASLTEFAGRDKQWAVTPLLGEVAIYVEDSAGSMVNIGGTGISGPDGDGWVTIVNAQYYPYDPVTRTHGALTTANVMYHPGMGVVRFVHSVSRVECDYTPALLRLTTHSANESNPSAFVETYRYIDEGGNPAPDPYDPRIWVFWVQEGMGTQGAEIKHLTLRETQAERWRPERAARSVPVDHGANEFGLCAVKDPVYAQVWLFWSSTRGAPTAAGGAAVDSDLYYQAFIPDLP